MRIRLPTYHSITITFKMEKTPLHNYSCLGHDGQLLHPELRKCLHDDFEKEVSIHVSVSLAVPYIRKSTSREYPRKPTIQNTWLQK
jgi:hypothetical protein